MKLNLEKGIFLEDKNILLPWKEPLSQLAKLLHKKIDPEGRTVDIGSHVFLSGLHFSQMRLCNFKFERNIFDTFIATGSPEMLDHLEVNLEFSCSPIIRAQL